MFSGCGSFTELTELITCIMFGLLFLRSCVTPNLVLNRYCIAVLWNFLLCCWTTQITTTNLRIVFIQRPLTSKLRVLWVNRLALRPMLQTVRTARAHFFTSVLTVVSKLGRGLPMTRMTQTSMNVAGSRTWKVVGRGLGYNRVNFLGRWKTRRCF